MSRYSFADVFSGVGGSSLGFVRAGFVPVGAVDVDEIANATYQMNIGLHPITADATRVSSDKLSRMWGTVDVLVGCPPCQGFSDLLAKRRGFADDPRNNLVVKFLKIIEVIEPRAVVFENVDGINRGAGRRYLELFIRSLRKLGYHVACGSLNAADYGVPQRRIRMIVIASRESELGLPPPTHGDPNSDLVSNGELKPWRTVRDAISDLPPLQPGERHPDVPNHYAKPLPPHWLELVKRVPKDGGSRTSVPERYWLPCHRRNPKVFTNVFSRLWWDRPSVTITTGAWDPSKGRFVHPEQDRGLSLREAARLQTFPDDFVFLGTPPRIIKHIGNAFPPLLSEIIAEWVKKTVL